MNIEVRGKLTEGERKTFQTFHNGDAICDTIDQMQKDGITSTIMVLGFMESQSIIVNQYEAYIVESEDVIRLSASNARAIVSQMNAIRS